MSILNKITSNIFLFTLFEFILLILLFLTLYVWKPTLEPIKRIFIQHDIDVSNVNVNIYDRNPLIRAVIMFSCIFLMLILFFFVKNRIIHNLENNNNYTINKFLQKTFFTVLSIIGIIFLIVYLLKGLHKIDWKIVFDLFVGISFFLILITLMYLFFVPFLDKDYLTTNKSPLLKVLLYVPSIVLSFINVINKRFNVINPAWTLLFLEILLILMYFICPIIWKWIYMNDGIQIIKNPLYLNNRYSLGDLYDKYYKDGNFNQGLNYGFFNNNIDLIDKKHQHIYTISFWYYINPQPPNTNKAYVNKNGANIFNFGNKPLVKYYGKENSMKIFTRVDNKNLEELIEIYNDTELKYQKWNNIVIIYDGGNMDIFKNSKIVGTKQNISPYMTYDIMEIGENDGIHGGICNVMYYNRKISMNEILVNYKMFNLKGEPYFD